MIADNASYVKLEELVHHALVAWNHGSSPDTRTRVVMQAIWPEIEAIVQAERNELAKLIRVFKDTASAQSQPSYEALAQAVENRA